MVTVPPTLTLRAAGRWRLRTSTPTPGIGRDGRQQWLRREARVWMNRIQVRGTWGQRGWGEYDAFLDALVGPGNTFRVPICNARTPLPGDSLPNYWSDLGISEADQLTGIPFSDGALFADGVGFALPGGEDPAIVADAPVGARIIRVSGATGEMLWIGAYLSIDDFLYRVEANDAGTLTINPPLRAAVAADDVVAVSEPFIRVRLASDAAAEAAHDAQGFGAPHFLDVVEAFQR